MAEQPDTPFHSPESALEAIDAMDHAEFDARFVLLHQHRSQWVRSSLEEGTPNFTYPQLTLHVQRKIAEVLKTTKGFERQKLDDDRTVMTYVAFEAIIHSLRNVHLRDLSLHEMAAELREDLMKCLKNHHLMSSYSESPLWEKGRMTKGNNGREYWVHDIDPQKDRWDIKLIEGIAGAEMNKEQGIRHVETMVTRAVPYLTTLDATQIHVTARQMRKDVWDTLGCAKEFYEELRNKLLPVILEHWLAEIGDDPMGHMQQLEQSVGMEEYLRKLYGLPEKTIDSRLRAYGLMPRGSLHEKIRQLAKQDMRSKTVAGPTLIKPDAEMTEEESQAALMALFTPYLIEGEKLTAKEEANVKHRLPALEFYLLQAITRIHTMRETFPGCDDEKHHMYAEYCTAVSTVTCTQEMLRILQQKMKLTWHDHPSLGYAEIAAAVYASNVDMSKFRGIL